MKKLLIACLVGLVTLSFSGMSLAAGPAKKPTYLLRFGHVMTDQDAFHKAYLKWSKAVSDRTNGDLVIDVFPSAQLGVEEDVLEQMRQGSNIGWQTDAARLGNYVREISVLNAPYFVENLDEVKGLLKSKTVAGWNKRLADEFKIKVVSFAYVQGSRSIFSNKIGKSPNELKGMLIRTAGAPIWVESVKSIGPKPVSLPYGELYNGIQSGMVDGCELPYAAAFNLKVFEVAKNIIETKHIYQMNFMVVSSAWFDKLPAEYQKILEEECTKAGLEVSESLATNADNVRQELIKKGMKYIPQSELDLVAFKKASASAYDALKLIDARDAVYSDLGKKLVK
jgi:TRAP-type C4-dicarboxylate transport system substrate-binding protein